MPRSRSQYGAGSEDIVPPEMIPVIEAGGGVAEGFEQSEAQLVENAEDGPIDGTDRILDDAPETEAEEDRAVYGDADHELVEDDEEGD